MHIPKKYKRKQHYANINSATRGDFRQGADDSYIHIPTGVRISGMDLEGKREHEIIQLLYRALHPKPRYRVYAASIGVHATEWLSSQCR